MNFIPDLNNLNTNSSTRLSSINELYRYIKSMNNPTEELNIYRLIDKNILFSFLNNESKELRLAAIKLILSFLYKEIIPEQKYQLKEENFKELILYFNFYPIGQLIALNWLPQGLNELMQSNINLMKILVDDLNSSHYQNRKYWIWPPNEKYNNDNIIPDPQKYLICIYKDNNINKEKIISNKNHKEYSALLDKLEVNEDKLNASSLRFSTSEHINQFNQYKNQIRNKAYSKSIDVPKQKNDMYQAKEEEQNKGKALISNKGKTKFNDEITNKIKRVVNQIVISKKK